MRAADWLGPEPEEVPVLVLLQRQAKASGESNETVTSILARVRAFLDPDDVLDVPWHHKGDTSEYTEFGHAQIRSFEGLFPSCFSTLDPATNEDDYLFDQMHSVAWGGAMVLNEHPRVGPGIPTQRDDWVGWMEPRWLVVSGCFSVCDSSSLLIFRAVTQNVSLFAVSCSLYFQLHCQLRMWNFSCYHCSCKCWKSCIGKDVVLCCDGLSYLYIYTHVKLCFFVYIYISYVYIYI